VMTNFDSVGIVGLGKLGLPLATVIAKAGFDVLGVDNSSSLIQKLNSKNFGDFTEPKLQEYLETSCTRMIFSDSMPILQKTQLVYLILPTPSKEDGKFNSSVIEKACEDLVQIWKDSRLEHTIVIVSTVNPGDTQRINLNLQKRLIEFNTKVELLYSPEFIALGSVIKNLECPDTILIGCDNNSSPGMLRHLNIMNAITETKSVPTKVMSFQEAELAKILVNCFVTMKISFANFVGQLSYAFPEHVSADKILDAVGEDSRIGKLYLRSGLGFAGPCFPRDNRALTAVSRDFGLDAKLSKAVDSINSSIPVETVKRLASQFTHGSLGIVGVAYKKDTTVIEESQTLEIAHLWSEEIGEVLWWDPLVQELPENSQSLTKVESVANLQSCDIIICAFDFKDFLPDDLLNSGKCFVL